MASRSGTIEDAVVAMGSRYGLTERLIDSLHTEALILADEARGYFEFEGRTERNALRPSDRVAFSCESLKVTTRLMHVVAWLLVRRTPSGSIARRPLGEVGSSDPHTIAALPRTARQLIVASRDLHGRVRRLEAGMEKGCIDGDSPALTLMRQLEAAL